MAASNRRTSRAFDVDGLGLLHGTQFDPHSRRLALRATYPGGTWFESAAPATNSVLKRQSVPVTIIRRMSVRTLLERGPKGKKVVAVAIDWPGWSRGAKTAEQALDLLESYRERYGPVAALAGMVAEFDAAGPLKVVEHKVGTGSTDFWGISFSPAAVEREPMDDTEINRKIALLQACWDYFDAVAARVSAEMRKGARGGGRDRDQIISHTIRTESEYFAKRLGLRVPEGGALTPMGLREYRETYVARMRAYNVGEGKRMRSWNLPFLIRHSAFHTMDHAWEMEDKDLSTPPSGRHRNVL